MNFIVHIIRTVLTVVISIILSAFPRTMCTKIITGSLNPPHFQTLLTIKNKRFLATYETLNLNTAAHTTTTTTTTTTNSCNNNVTNATMPIDMKPSSTMQARILKKAWYTDKDFKKSTLKMWSTHLRGVQFTRTQLELYQKKLMNSIKVDGIVSNTMTKHGINQWHFYNHEKMTTASTTNNCSEACINLPVLLIHGYASSSISFFRNIPYLSRHCKDLYTIDLPANGLSEQPKLKITSVDPSIFGQYIELNEGRQIKVIGLPDRSKCQKFIEENINYYIDAIEKWRLDNKIEKFHLVGHSFGGYLSYQYALKYPDSIDKLCLISPLGVEKNILSTNSNTQRELGQILEKNFEDPSDDKYSKRVNIPKYIFENQLKILRWGGPMGARLCWNYITSAYSKVPSLEFKEYMFELFYGKGGLSPIARIIFVNLFTRSLLARNPIMDSLDQLQVKDVLFCYGQHDWMNKTAGKMAVQSLNKLNRIKEQRQTAKYLEIPMAGHNLFLDNPEIFNLVLTSYLRG